MAIYKLIGLCALVKLSDHNSENNGASPQGLAILFYTDSRCALGRLTKPLFGSSRRLRDKERAYAYNLIYPNLQICTSPDF